MMYPNPLNLARLPMRVSKEPELSPLYFSPMRVQPISFVLRARHSRSAIPSLSLLLLGSRKRAISGSTD